MEGEVVAFITSPSVTITSVAARHEMDGLDHGNPLSDCSYFMQHGKQAYANHTYFILYFDAILYIIPHALFRRQVIE